jgi:hypothetical protein
MPAEAGIQEPTAVFLFNNYQLWIPGRGLEWQVFKNWYLRFI